MEPGWSRTGMKLYSVSCNRIQIPSMEPGWSRTEMKLDPVSCNRIQIPSLETGWSRTGIKLNPVLCKHRLCQLSKVHWHFSTKTRGRQLTVTFPRVNFQTMETTVLADPPPLRDNQCLMYELLLTWGTPLLLTKVLTASGIPSPSGAT